MTIELFTRDARTSRIITCGNRNRTNQKLFMRGCFKVWSPLTTSAADSAGVAQQLLRYLLGALDRAPRKGTRLVGRRRSRRVLFCGPRGSVSPFATSTWCHVSPTRAPPLIPLSPYDYYEAQRPPLCPARPPRRPYRTRACRRVHPSRVEQGCSRGVCGVGRGARSARHGARWARGTEGGATRRGASTVTR